MRKKEYFGTLFFNRQKKCVKKHIKYGKNTDLFKTIESLNGNKAQKMHKRTMKNPY